MRTPEFWYETEPTVLARALKPAGCLLQCAGRLRNATARSWQAFVPVLCVGNAVAGGAGKTPVAQSLARLLIERGRKPHFLSRGYGGSLGGPVRVDPARHTSKDVGDEALLLARIAPTWVARNRRKGCQAATLDDADVIVMDDGLQNPGIHKTVSLLVVDGTYGFGNHCLLPAGPLREPVEQALARADAVAILGADQAGVTAEIKALDPAKPVLHARLAPGPDADRLPGQRVLAFAGIGLPEKFFAQLRVLGCEIAATRAFADHHAYTARDIAALREQAEALNARLITTEKDAVRLSDESRRGVIVLPVSVVWQDEFAVEDILDMLFPAPSTP
ncbi:MAG: tetraacyldisaccharide 4'-kinase [Rhodospirillales bacterium]